MQTTQEITQQVTPKVTPQTTPQKQVFKSGFVALVGRPNAGKSTLSNTLVGKKLAITSNTAQTTRRRISAVLTRPEFQIVFVDTPGLHKPHDILGKELNASALSALSDVDVVAMLIDAAAPIGRGDEWVAEQVRASPAKKICVLSKCDTATPAQISAQRQAAEKLGHWDAMVALSSQTKKNLDAFIEEVAYFLPEGPLWFPKDMETDQSQEMIVAEFIREKILRSARDEVPHSIGVVTTDMHTNPKTGMISIEATIYVERESQKGIIVGRAGANIKHIGTQARKDLEHLFNTRVYLHLMVKVKKDWRRDEHQIHSFGYGCDE